MKRKVPPAPDRPVRFIPCNENSQTYNWQKTSGRSSDVKYAKKEKNIKWV